VALGANLPSAGTVTGGPVASSATRASTDLGRPGSLRRTMAAIG
jgi:hypothetical protein